MTDKPDTTREAVERLARGFDIIFCRPPPVDYTLISAARSTETATTLRTLAAENDALRAEVASILAENDALRFTLNNANAALRQAVERARREALEEAAPSCPIQSMTCGRMEIETEPPANPRLWVCRNHDCPLAIRARRGCGQ
jgi:hypothetical protein